MKNNKKLLWGGKKRAKAVAKFGEKSLAAARSSFRIPLMSTWTQLNRQVTIGRKRSARRSGQTDEEKWKHVTNSSLWAMSVLCCVCVCV